MLPSLHLRGARLQSHRTIGSGTVVNGLPRSLPVRSLHAIPTLLGPTRHPPCKGGSQVCGVGWEQSQVGGVVVGHIPVDMIHNFALLQPTSKKVVHYYPVNRCVTCLVCPTMTSLRYCPDQIAVLTVFGHSTKYIPGSVKSMSTPPARVGLQLLDYPLYRQPSSSCKLSHSLGCYVHFGGDHLQHPPIAVLTNRSHILTLLLTLT